jgi:hypothetical protein
MNLTSIRSPDGQRLGAEVLVAVVVRAKIVIVWELMTRSRGN